MLPYFLMTLSVSFTVLNGTFLHKFANRGLNNAGDVFLFNGMLSLVWAVLLFLLSCVTGGLQWDGTTFLFGLMYAFVLCSYQLFKSLALATGPISMTTLVANCAFLITTAYAFFFEGDSISPWQLCGIVLLLVALLLCIRPKAGQGDGGMRFTLRWAIFSFCLFLSGGGVGIIYRLFGQSAVRNNATSMLFFAATLSFLFFCILAYTTNSITHKPRAQLSGTAWRYALLCGMTGCIYIRMNLSLSAVIPPIIFFPVSNGATVILSAIVGWIIFKEKLKPSQIAGILLGMAAIVCIGCF